MRAVHADARARAQCVSGAPAADVRYMKRKIRSVCTEHVAVCTDVCEAWAQCMRKWGQECGAGRVPVSPTAAQCRVLL